MGWFECSVEFIRLKLTQFSGSLKSGISSISPSKNITSFTENVTNASIPQINPLPLLTSVIKDLTTVPFDEASFRQWIDYPRVSCNCSFVHYELIAIPPFVPEWVKIFDKLPPIIVEIPQIEEIFETPPIEKVFDVINNSTDLTIAASGSSKEFVFQFKAYFQIFYEYIFKVITNGTIDHLIFLLCLMIASFAIYSLFFKDVAVLDPSGESAPSYSPSIYSPLQSPLLGPIDAPPSVKKEFWYESIIIELASILHFYSKLTIGVCGALYAFSRAVSVYSFKLTSIVLCPVGRALDWLVDVIIWYFPIWGEKLFKAIVTLALFVSKSSLVFLTTIVFPFLCFCIRLIVMTVKLVITISRICISPSLIKSCYVQAAVASQYYWYILRDEQWCLLREELHLQWYFLREELRDFNRDPLGPLCRVMWDVTMNRYFVTFWISIFVIPPVNANYMNRWVTEPFEFMYRHIRDPTWSDRIYYEYDYTLATITVVILVNIELINKGAGCIFTAKILRRLLNKSISSAMILLRSMPMAAYEMFLALVNTQFSLRRVKYEVCRVTVKSISIFSSSADLALRNGSAAEDIRRREPITPFSLFHCYIALVHFIMYKSLRTSSLFEVAFHLQTHEAIFMSILLILINQSIHIFTSEVPALLEIVRTDSIAPISSVKHMLYTYFALVHFVMYKSIIRCCAWEIAFQILQYSIPVTGLFIFMKKSTRFAYISSEERLEILRAEYAPLEPQVQEQFPGSSG